MMMVVLLPTCPLSWGLSLFMAPEIFTGPYTNKCDVFSIGVVFACIAEMLCQIKPYGDCLADIVNSSVLNESAGSYIHYRKATSEEKDIISRMLE
eukprot:m.123322 g.123322  ORF g.123322 m.123322 type:complete len:95 (+) comp37820_c0_seq1:554-838(+)